MDKKSFNLDDIKENIKEDNRKAFRVLILTLLAKGRKEDVAKATEEIVKDIIQKEKIYTIRDDVKTEIWIYKEGIYIPQGSSYIKEHVREILDDVYSNRLASDILNKIIVDTYIDAKDFFIDEPPELVPCNNGILNIKTKELSPFSDQFFFFNKIPVTYDETKKCPNIEKFFNEVLANKDDSAIMQELFGYLIYRTQKYAKAMLFCGEGRNGKGVTLNLMKHFLGMDNIANVPLQQLESDIFATSELHKKLANLGGDISKTALKGTGMFKTITGGDLISVARKFMTRISFVCYAKLLFCANEVPMTTDLTLAFFNRWILIDFPYTYLKQKEYDNIIPEERESSKIRLADPELIEKLTGRDELSGLLNWALTGLQRLENGRDFSYSCTTEEIKQTWLRKSNSFYSFCLDMLEESYDSKITKQHLREVYAKYCREHKLMFTTDKTIKRILCEMFGVSEIRIREEDMQVHYWVGVKFRGVSQVSQVSYLISTQRQSDIDVYRGKLPDSPDSPDSLNGQSRLNQDKDALNSKEATKEETILQCMTEHAKPPQSLIKVDLLLSHAKSKGITEKEFDGLISAMKKSGAIFEPRTGKLGKI